MSNQCPHALPQVTTRNAAAVLAIAENTISDTVREFWHGTSCHPCTKVITQYSATSQDIAALAGQGVIAIMYGALPTLIGLPGLLVAVVIGVTVSE